MRWHHNCIIHSFCGAYNFWAIFNIVRVGYIIKVSMILFMAVKVGAYNSNLLKCCGSEASIDGVPPVSTTARNIVQFWNPPLLFRQDIPVPLRWDRTQLIVFFDYQRCSGDAGEIHRRFHWQYP